MPVCKFFLEGRCRYGDNCRFEHPRGGAQRSLFGNDNWQKKEGQRVTFRDSFNSSGQNDRYKWSADSQQNQGTAAQQSSLDVVSSLPKEIEMLETSKMWPFTCMGLEGNSPSIPDLYDISYEELRDEAYQAIKAGNITPYVDKYNQLLRDFTNKRNQLKHMTMDAKKKLMAFLDNARKGISTGSKTASSIGSQTQNPSSLFSQPNANSSFGASSGLFGKQSLVNSSSGSTSFGTSSPAQPTFGTSQPAFGTSNPAQPTFGTSNPVQPTFSTSNQAQSTFVTSSPAQPTFGMSSPAQPMFGASNPAQPTFGTSNPAQPTFGTSNPAQPTFGTSNPAQPTFGTSSSAESTFGTFSSSQPTFGNTDPSNSPFGKPANSAPMTLFGKPVTSILGTQTSQPPNIFATALPQKPSLLGPGPTQPNSTSIFAPGPSQSHSSNIFASGLPQPNNTSIFAPGPSQTNIFAQAASQQSAGSFSSGSTFASSPPSTGSQFGQSTFAANPPTKPPAMATPQSTTSGLYTPLASLNDQEKEAFMAKSFQLGKIPLRPPPLELIS